MNDAVYSEDRYTTLSFSDFVGYSRRNSGAESVRIVKDKKLIFLKVLVALICVFLLMSAVVHFCLVPLMEPVNFQFYGVRNLTAEQLNERVGEMGGLTWMEFDTGRAVSVLSSVASVEQVSVDKHFPNTVYVRVRERVPVAKTIVSINGRSVPIQIDKNGVLFSSNAASVLNDSNIPLISGLPLENVQDGTRLPSRYRSLMEQIAAIQELDQNYFAAISEIHVVPKEYGSYELVMYPIHVKLKVLVDHVLTEETLKYMMVFLDVVNTIEADMSEIDLRYGALSYRTTAGSK